MDQKDLLLELTIPLYMREYIASNSIKAKYYEKGKKEIPLKYCNKAVFKAEGVREPDGVNFTWQPFPVVRQGKKKMIEYLVETAYGRRIVANESHVGNQKKVNINGQAIYNGNIARFARNNMIGQIKDQFKKHLVGVKPIPADAFPIRLVFYVFDTLIDDYYSNGQDWDLDNRFFPYGKAFNDILTKEKIIPNDHIYYVTQPPHPIFVPVEDTEDRKFIIRIYKDTRPAILNNFLMNKYHGRIKSNSDGNTTN